MLKFEIMIQKMYTSKHVPVTHRSIRLVSFFFQEIYSRITIPLSIRDIFDISHFFLKKMDFKSPLLIYKFCKLLFIEILPTPQ